METFSKTDIARHTGANDDQSLSDTYIRDTGSDRRITLLDLASDVAFKKTNVLVLGAGFSLKATGTDWSKLTDHMCSAMQDAECDLPKNWDRLSFPQRAQAFLRAFKNQDGDCRLENLALENTKIKDGFPTDVEKAILSIGVQYIVTTNYDNLIERTLDALKIPHRVIADEYQLAVGGVTPPHGGVLVVKMHGDARSRNLVVASSDYDDYRKSRPEMSAFVQGLMLKKPILYGLGLSDPNLDQLMFPRNAVREVGRGYVFGADLTQAQLDFAQRHDLRLISFGTIPDMVKAFVDVSKIAQLKVDQLNCPSEQAKQLGMKPVLELQAKIASEVLKNAKRIVEEAEAKGARNLSTDPNLRNDVRNSFKQVALISTQGQKVPKVLLLRYAEILLESGDNESARVAYEKAKMQTVGPDKAINHFNRFRLYLRLKDERNAISEFESLKETADFSKFKDRIRLAQAVKFYLGMSDLTIVQLVAQQRTRATELVTLEDIKATSSVVFRLHKHLCLEKNKNRLSDDAWQDSRDAYMKVLNRLSTVVAGTKMTKKAEILKSISELKELVKQDQKPILISGMRLLKKLDQFLR